VNLDRILIYHFTKESDHEPKKILSDILLSLEIFCGTENTRIRNRILNQTGQDLATKKIQGIETGSSVKLGKIL